MDPPSTAQAYDVLAARWQDHAFNAQNGVKQHRRALSFLDRQPGAWALNAGCGCNTRLNPLMRAHGLQIEGIDVSAQMIALARSRPGGAAAPRRHPRLAHPARLPLHHGLGQHLARAAP